MLKKKQKDLSHQVQKNHKKKKIVKQNSKGSKKGTGRGKDTYKRKWRKISEAITQKG